MSEHVVVIHRWRDSHALYARYLDHAAFRVSYVTTPMGRQSVPADVADIVEVAATDDLPAVFQAVTELVERHGPPARVVALNEGDLDTAAVVRGLFGCPGQTRAELAPFRDKLAMTTRVADAGLRAPAFADAPDAEVVAAFAAEHGWPLIVKPRLGTASRGVLRLDGPADLAAVDATEPRLVQTYCGDPIYHVDGLWDGTELGPWRASRYLNTCVDFTTGAMLGSVEEDDPVLLAAIGEFAAGVGAALGGSQPWVFHLEVFVGAELDGTPRVTFLEAGNRVGGAEIPFLWREVHGVDLMAAAMAIQLGEVPSLPSLPPREQGARVGGWLLVPTPVAAPCRVVAAKSRPDIEGAPYARIVPPVGYRIPKVGGYEHVGARFRFRGERTAEVAEAILATAAGFRLECVPDSEAPLTACTNAMSA
ncbi:hypothetical protein SAMN05192558_103248 [Actinokineospora alba]|uniref:ATP-grasp domain-containing protein n=1 Tax=Actinokineospora alba TaxID=504798 RepID=A0A1H0JWF9_9PSEU|nr:biotin carboxylase [Actinokineospora alba]TDP68132.1 hypothetical protein C8E96_3694 [Actinokineospora alba]SDH92900.1 hypothetical protein SAMN05421871_102801 [Actinokineospora alba]SDO48118.1 hypothetical protein SAMN05192558_103248 [Actinokineospora alba]